MIRRLSETGLNSYMVHPAGFEPTTPAFGGQYSIQLSYGCDAGAMILIWPGGVQLQGGEGANQGKVLRLRQVALVVFVVFWQSRLVLLMPARQSISAAFRVGKHRQGDD